MPLPLDDFIRVAKALADGRRFAILERIAERGDAACQHLCQEFPVSQPTMSHHLHTLAEAGLIEMRRDGQYAHYRFRAETVRAFVTTLEARVNLRSPRTSSAPARRRDRVSHERSG